MSAIDNMVREEYIEKIIEQLQETNDVALLDLVLQLLQKSQPAR